MIFKSHGLDATSLLVHVGVDNTRLHVVHSEIWVSECERVPETVHCKLRHTVGGELRSEVHMRSGRVDLHGDCILCGMSDKGLRDVKRSRNVLLDGLEELLAVDIGRGLEGSRHRRVADQDIDFTLPDEPIERGVDVVLVRDIGRSHEDFEVRKVLLEGGFRIEEWLLSATKEGDPRCTRCGKAARRLCADASAWQKRISV